MKYRKFRQDKLWREKAIEKMEAMGSIIHTTTLDDQMLKEKLKVKLVEEIQETLSACDKQALIEELADVLEVIEAYAKVHQIDLTEVEQIKQKKKMERGGFYHHRFVTIAEHPVGGFGESYCLKDPAKYPEVTTSENS